MIIDVQKAIAFYELRDEIVETIEDYFTELELANMHILDSDKKTSCRILLYKIEALDKEGE